MARKRKVDVHLHGTRQIRPPSEIEIEHILRAADEIIDRAGRVMLVKILKGSKEKKILEFGLDECPSYGYYKNRKKEDVELIVDWMIWNRYLRIVYNGRLPMIAFTDKGWELYKPFFAWELISKMVHTDFYDKETLVEEMKTVNREVIDVLFEEIIMKDITGAIEFLEYWQPHANKRVAKHIGNVLRQLN